MPSRHRGPKVQEGDIRMPGPTGAEINATKELSELLHTSPIPGEDLLDNLLLYVRPQVFSLTLGLADIYQRILDVHGAVFDLGTRYGRNMVVFSALRRIFEPYNHFRRIIGFDTFEGLPEPVAQDGADAEEREGFYSVPAGYERHLRSVLDCQERHSPLAHISRTEVRTGDAVKEVPRFLEEHPETVVALAYFDMDLYEPTKAALEAILPHTTKGSVLAFDEPTHPRFPGETLAIKKVLGTRKHKLQRSPQRAHPAFIVLD
jgi:hypothetical protein